MDINSLNAAYSELYTQKSSQSASKLEGNLSADFENKTDEELMDACKEFEAYFLEMMFKEMMKTIPQSEESSSYGSNMLDYYKDSMIQEIASESTETNGLGMAQMLYEQMKRNYEV